VRGVRVLIPRAAHDPLCQALRERGAVALSYPVIEQVAVASNPPDWSNIAWVVFSSKNGVRFFSDYLENHQLMLPDEVRFAAIGEATAEAICAYGLGAGPLCSRFGERVLNRERKGQAPSDTILVSHLATAENLVDILRQKASPQDGRVLLPQAEQARPTLGNGLEAAGFQVERWVMYRTQSVKATTPPPTCDAVIFTSPTTVWGLLDNGGWNAGAKVITMGPTTSRAVVAAGFIVHQEAAPHSLIGLVEAIEAVYRKES
jgi:uroporphyrinogen-III synthase